MDPFTDIVKAFSSQARRKRAGVFRDRFSLDERTKLLDLGSEDGSNIRDVIQPTDIRPENVYIADIDSAAVARGSERYGFSPVVIGESGRLPFPDGFFDVVYCSSVIEHVTVPKGDVWRIRSGREFERRARERQREFAREIKRLGRQYFVQTPYRHFPIESHSWLPFIAWLPRRLLVPVLRLTNKFWVKRTSPDWHLLDAKEMIELFEGATIIYEKSFGLTKSMMAVYSESRRPSSV